jgi:hypothetical protein
MTAKGGSGEAGGKAAEKPAGEPAPGDANANKAASDNAEAK